MSGLRVVASPALRSVCFHPGIVSLLCFAVSCGSWHDAPTELDYSLVDSDLKLVRIDSDPQESFLAIQLDTAGRLFVGGREALFVYEPSRDGGYEPRQELYRFPDHTWIYDIAIRGNDLYVLTVAALYLIRDGVSRRQGLEPERLVWGIPQGHVHQCLHGMVQGPEGDLYFASGDPLWFYGDFSRPDHWGHWTYFFQPEGSRLPYTGVGGVLRCRPDGSRLQVVSGGQRNSCGLAFDSRWNLFSNDNDHEGMPSEFVPGRLLHVTPKAYFGWPRGWLLSKDRRRADLLETMHPDLGRFVPVGQSYYNETFLPEKYRDNLLVARWGSRSVPRYRLRPHGATFQADEIPFLEGRNHARPVGVAVGRGGRIFLNISYMAHNEGSPVYPSDLVMVTRADDEPSHPFDAYEATEVSSDRLWLELSNPSWWRRYRAHIEILRRGGSLLEEAVERLGRGSAADPATGHLVWLAGARRSTRAMKLLTRLSSHADDELRLQAVRALVEYAESDAAPGTFVRLLSDPVPQIRLAALLSFFDGQGPVPEQVVQGPARSSDTYLRQTATRLLAKRASLDQLRRLCRSSDPETRLAGVLAAGFRLTLPPTTEPIPERLPLDQSREEHYVVQYSDGREDLRRLGRIGNFTVADHWAVGRRSPEQGALFQLLLAMLEDQAEPVRLQAAQFLFLLNDSRSEEGVQQVYRLSDERRLAVSGIRKTIQEVWTIGPYPDGDTGFGRAHPPEDGAVNLSRVDSVQGRDLAWQRLEAGRRLFDLCPDPGTCDRSSFYGYFRLESPRRQRANLLVGSDDGVKIWQDGAVIWDNPLERAALPFQDVISLQLETGSNDFLVRVQNTTGTSGLYLSYRTLGDVDVVLPEPMDSATLARRLREASSEEKSIPKDLLGLDWVREAEQGDVVRGKELYRSLACTKCHAIGSSGEGTGGPSLSDARKRFTVSYLVESILLPDQSLSPVFRETELQTKDGEVRTGLVVGETGQKIDFLQGDGSRLTIEKQRVKSRRLLDSSPMPHGLIESPDELRDLLTFILSSGS